MIRPISPVQITVTFFSYFRDLTGCARVVEEVPAGTRLEELHRRLGERFPKLAAMKNSTLLAVGVNYEPRSYVLREGDEVALFPPVQGG